jgi:hypothetical protein
LLWVVGSLVFSLFIFFVLLFPITWRLSKVELLNVCAVFLALLLHNMHMYLVQRSRKFFDFP